MFSQEVFQAPPRQKKAMNENIQHPLLYNRKLYRMRGALKRCLLCSRYNVSSLHKKINYISVQNIFKLTQGIAKVS